MDINQLCDASRKGDNSLVQAILDTGEVDVNGTDQYGRTPLHIAMWHNHPSVVTTLLSSTDTRLDVTSTFRGRTALHLACRYNCASVIGIFGRDYRCTPATLNMKDNAGDTAVMVAVEQGHLDSVSEMAKMDGTDFGTKNGEGQTLIEVARKCKKPQIVHFLEERNKSQAESKWKKIAQDLANIEAIETIMVSTEKQMEDRHKDEIENLSKKQKEEKKEHGNLQLENKIKGKDLASKEELMEDRHNEEIEKLREKQKEEKKEHENLCIENKIKGKDLASKEKPMEDRHKEEIDKLGVKQNEEKKKQENLRLANKIKRNDLLKTLQVRLNTSAPSTDGE
eukprot:GFUD01013365.1.p1 GENE.GFUD01013365.1~~GFUD01013365.1.p1  ORF type:complete len:338 (+),score=116.46 GFUD01013365.1:142-1155(+)